MFFVQRDDRHGANPALCFMRTTVFFTGQSGRGVKLSSHALSC